jgi:hypothetical protein
MESIKIKGIIPVIAFCESYVIHWWFELIINYGGLTSSNIRRIIPI